MTYQEALTYLDSFINYEKIPFYNYKRAFRLNRVKRFLNLLGNPQENLKAVHITGSKGKGSTAAFIYSILRETGLKTGLYTSPHLISFRERIKINGEEIPEEELSLMLDEIKPAVEKMEKTNPPTFFEVYTAAAFLYFKKIKVDFAVLEVGLGGRFDATNVVDAKVAAITPISYEHTKKLGNTLSQIAFEKSGIIKTGAICISSPQEPEAMEVIKNRCRRRKAKLFCVGEDIVAQEHSYNDREQYFSVRGRFGDYRGLRLKLLGQHQIINAAMAVGIAESLRAYGVPIPETAIKNGLMNAEWPGRLEVVAETPRVIMDGAQNVASAKALVSAVKRHFVFDRVILVIGVSSDKDIAGISRVLSELADEVIVTRADSQRAADPEEIAHFFKDKPLALTHDSEEAIRVAYSKAKRKDLILITGSLFLVGELKNKLQTHA